jgi:uncharacterized membrane protein
MAHLILPVHIAGGVLALAFGYVALFAAKGETLHRKTGLLFVVAMVALSLSGALIAALNSSSVSVVAGLLTFYFVTTSLLTVRRRTEKTFWIDAGAMMIALTVGAAAFKTGLELSASGRPETAPMFIFGIVAALAAMGDIRLLRAGGLEGSQRLKRHLWRMCFAMWVAAASFFWGPRGRVPEIIYYPALLPIPVLTPVVVMVYWLWRLRRKRRTLNRVAIPEPRQTAIAKAAS